MVDNTLYQRMAKPFFHCPLTPFVFDRLVFILPLYCFREFHQPFRRVGPAIQQHVFHQLQQILGYLLVNIQHAGVDDPHIQPSLDRVVKEC